MRRRELETAVFALAVASLGAAALLSGLPDASAALDPPSVLAQVGAPPIGGTDRLVLEPGTHPGPIVVDAPDALVCGGSPDADGCADEPGPTVVQAPPGRPALVVEAPNVTVRGLVVESAGLEPAVEVRSPGAVLRDNAIRGPVDLDPDVRVDAVLNRWDARTYPDVTDRVVPEDRVRVDLVPYRLPDGSPEPGFPRVAGDDGSHTPDTEEACREARDYDDDGRPDLSWQDGRCWYLEVQSAVDFAHPGQTVLVPASRNPGTPTPRRENVVVSTNNYGREDGHDDQLLEELTVCSVPPGQPPDWEPPAPRNGTDPACGGWSNRTIIEGAHAGPRLPDPSDPDPSNATAPTRPAVSVQAPDVHVSGLTLRWRTAPAGPTDPQVGGGSDAGADALDGNTGRPTSRGDHVHPRPGPRVGLEVGADGARFTDGRVVVQPGPCEVDGPACEGMREDAGVRLAPSSDRPTVRNVSIQAPNGVVVEGDETTTDRSVALVGSDLRSTAAPLHLGPNTTRILVEAPGNLWGAAQCDAIAHRIHDEGARNVVLYVPFNATTPTGDPTDPGLEQRSVHTCRSGHLDVQTEWDFTPSLGEAETCAGNETKQICFPVDPSREEPGRDKTLSLAVDVTDAAGRERDLGGLPVAAFLLVEPPEHATEHETPEPSEIGRHPVEGLFAGQRGEPLVERPTGVEDGNRLTFELEAAALVPGDRDWTEWTFRIVLPAESRQPDAARRLAHSFYNEDAQGQSVGGDALDAEGTPLGVSGEPEFLDVEGEERDLESFVNFSVTGLLYNQAGERTTHRTDSVNLTLVAHPQTGRTPGLGGDLSTTAEDGIATFDPVYVGGPPGDYTIEAAGPDAIEVPIDDIEANVSHGPLDRDVDGLPAQKVPYFTVTDNCAEIYNPDQTNTDTNLSTEGDSLGDACDPDDDNDGLSDRLEVREGADPLDPDTDVDGLLDGPEVHDEGTDPTLPDTDGDGLADQAEVEDRPTDPVDPDTDGDGLEDHAETVGDADADPVDDTLPSDPDTDGDGLPDGEEVSGEQNPFGEAPTLPNATDTDGDGLDDAAEIADHGSDPTAEHTDEDDLDDRAEVEKGTDPAADDTDGDGLLDGPEVDDHGTDPLDPDTDGDGLEDHAETVGDADADPVDDTLPSDPDTDGDGLPDGEEVSGDRNPFGQGPTLPNATDTDGDGLDDGAEVLDHGTDPLTGDTDGDDLDDRAEVEDRPTDPAEPDTDADGLDDAAEVGNGTDPLGPDTDGDGLDDGAEVLDHRTDPLAADTDGDGLADPAEVLDHGTDPLDGDTDGDGLLDGPEVVDHGTGPLSPDTDADAFHDLSEVENGTDPLDPDDVPEGPPPEDEIPPRTSPSLDPSPSASGWIPADRATVDLVSQDPNSGVEAVLADSVPGSAGDCETEEIPDGTLTVSGAGTHTVCYHARDEAGNVEEERNLTLRLDPDPPTNTSLELRRGGEPAGELPQGATATAAVEITDDVRDGVASSSVASASLVIQGPDGSEHTVGLDPTDGGSYEASIGPFATLGTYEATVEAADAAGNEHVATQTLSFPVLDVKPPKLDLLSPRNTTVEGNVTAEVEAADNDGIGDLNVTLGDRDLEIEPGPDDRWRTDGLNTTRLPNGEARLEVTATDDRGNTGVLERDIRIENPPTGELLFAGNASDPDGGRLNATAGDPLCLALEAQAGHPDEPRIPEVTVLQSVNGGETSQATVRPEPTPDCKAMGDELGADLNLSLDHGAGGGQVVRLHVQLDDGGVSTRVPDRGTADVDVEAELDDPGSWKGSNQTEDAEHDPGTGPHVQIRQAATHTTRDDALFTLTTADAFDTNETAWYTVRFDGDRDGTNDSYLRATYDDGGDWSVRAFDVVGEPDSPGGESDDLEAPELGPAPDQGQENGGLRWVRSAVEVNDSEGEDTVAFGADRSRLTDLLDGHRFFDVSYVALGSQSLTSPQLVDLEPPNLTLEAPPSSGEDRNVSIDVTANDPGGIALEELHYSSNGDPWAQAPVPDDTVTVGGFEPGTLRVFATATDEAGNQNTTATAEIEITDETPPVPSIQAPTEAVLDEEVRLDGAESRDNVRLDTLEWDLDGDGAFEASGLQVDHAFPTTGNQTVTLRARDAAANTNTTTHEVTVLDLTPPDVTITSPAPGLITNGTDLSVEGAADDNFDLTPLGDAVEVGLEGCQPPAAADHIRGNATSSTWNHTLDVASCEGSFELIATARDAAGNDAEAVEAPTVTLDRTPPVAKAGSPLQVEAGESFTLDAASSTDDVELDPSGYAWELEEGAVRPQRTVENRTVTHDYTTVGTYEAGLVVQDAAGNTDRDTTDLHVEPAALDEVRLDQEPPAKVAADASAIFEVTPVDAFGNPRSDALNCTVEAGPDEPGQCTVVDQDAGEVRYEPEGASPPDVTLNVTATDGEGVTAWNVTDPIEVVEGPLDEVRLRDEVRETLAADEVLTFEVTPVDAFGNPRSDALNCTVEAGPDEPGQCTVVDQDAGEVRYEPEGASPPDVTLNVTATDGEGVTAWNVTDPIEVVPGTLRQVLIQDGEGQEVEDLDLTTDDPPTLHAVGYDGNLNRIGPADVDWTTDGTLDPMGQTDQPAATFRPATAGTSGHVLVDHPDLADPVDDATGVVDVSVGQLHRVAFTEAPSATSADTPVDFTAVPLDADGNEREDTAITWAVENGTGSGTVDETGLLTPDQDGTVTVNASAVDPANETDDGDPLEAWNTTQLDISVGDPVDLTVDPDATGPLSADRDAVGFKATALDVRGNTFEVTQDASWSVLGPNTTDGHRTDAVTDTGVYDPVVAGGDRTIRAELPNASGEPITGHADVATVVPGEVAALAIVNGTDAAVGPRDVTTDASLDLRVEGRDADGNLLEGVVGTWNTTGSLDGIQAGPSTDATFSPSTANTTGRIVADNASVPGDPDAATGEIRVEAGALAGVDASAAPDFADVNETVTFPAVPRDADGNARTDVVTCRKTGGVGTVGTAGPRECRFTSPVPGSTSIEVEATTPSGENASTSLDLRTLPEGTRIRAPAAVAATPGEAVELPGEVVDGEGEPLEDVSVRWTVVDGPGTVDPDGTFHPPAEDNETAVEARFRDRSERMVVSTGSTELEGNATLETQGVSHVDEAPGGAALEHAAALAGGEAGGRINLTPDPASPADARQRLDAASVPLERNVTDFTVAVGIESANRSRTPTEVDATALDRIEGDDTSGAFLTVTATEDGTPLNGTEMDEALGPMTVTFSKNASFFRRTGLDPDRGRLAEFSEDELVDPEIPLRHTGFDPVRDAHNFTARISDFSAFAVVWSPRTTDDGTGGGGGTLYEDSVEDTATSAPAPVNATAGYRTDDEDVEAGGTYTVSFPDDEERLREVQARFEGRAGDVRLTIHRYPGTSEVPRGLPSGFAGLGALKVTAVSRTDPSPGPVGNVTVVFAFDTGRLADRNLSPEQVSLLHLDGGNWTRAPTTLLGIEKGEARYRAAAHHLSWFAFGADRAPPSVQVASPGASEPVPPASGLPVVVEAEDNRGVERVTLRVDETTVGTDALPPYEFVYEVPPLDLVDGPLEIQAVATDRSGQQASTWRNATVEGQDLAAPSLDVDLPHGPQRGKVWVNGTADDDRGISYVRLEVDGRPATLTTTLPFAVRLDLGSMEPGLHDLAVEATDLAGKTVSRNSTIVVEEDPGEEPSIEGEDDLDGGAGGVLPVLLVAGLLLGVGLAAVALSPDLRSRLDSLRRRVQEGD